MAPLTSTTAAPARSVQGPHRAAPKAHTSVARHVQQKANRALGPKEKAATLADIKKHDYSQLSADMAKMSGKQRLQALTDLRMNHPEEYNSLLSDVREGKVADAQIKIGIGIDRIHDTDWADTDQGKKAVAQLEQQYADGKIVSQSKAKIEGLGSTVNDDLKAGHDGKKTGSTINVASELLNSPDAAAAVLAHEGQHSARAQNGEMKPMVSEETDGNMALARVYTERSNMDTFKSSGSEEEKSLDTTSTFYDPGSPDNDKLMRAHVKKGYTEFYKTHPAKS